MVNVVPLDFPDKQIGILPTGDWQGFRSNACAKEPETVEWIRSFKPESVLWDIGASVGPYSLIADALGHSVFAFEPNGPSYGELCQNLWINDSKAKPFPIAVGTGPTIGELRFTTWRPGVGGHVRPEGKPVPVLWVSVDGLADSLGVPNHVKIDVDGGELGVIESGRALWPLVESVMVECSNASASDVELVLSGCGLERKNKWLRSGDEWNYLFVRAEQ